METYMEAYALTVLSGGLTSWSLWLGSGCWCARSSRTLGGGLAHWSCHRVALVFALRHAQKAIGPLAVIRAGKHDRYCAAGLLVDRAGRPGITRAASPGAEDSCRWRRMLFKATPLTSGWKAERSTCSSEASRLLRLPGSGCSYVRFGSIDGGGWAVWFFRRSGWSLPAGIRGRERITAWFILGVSAGCCHAGDLYTLSCRWTRVRENGWLTASSISP